MKTKHWAMQWQPSFARPSVPPCTNAIMRRTVYRMSDGRLTPFPPRHLSALAAMCKVETWQQNLGPRAYARMIAARPVGGFPLA